MNQTRFGPTVPALICAVALTTPMQAQRSNSSAAMQAARDGGVTLLCRHTATTDFREVEPVDYDDVETQRLLSRDGEIQARRMGAAFKSLSLVPVEVVPSPMNRAWRTAELMFGQPITIDSAWHTNGDDFSGPPSRRRTEVLSMPITGGNRLIVSHIGTMRNALGRSPGEVKEGDCVVVRPGGNTHEVVGIIPWRDWLRAAGERYFGFLKTLPPYSLAFYLSARAND